MKNSNNTLDQILQKIKSKKDIIFFQTLPDIHLKKEMEIPSSFVSVSKSSINLSMSSSALCDCISISEIKNSHGLINKKFTEVFFNLISQRTHPNKFGKNKYSLTVKDLEDYIINGPNLLLKKFNLDKKILNTIENNGFINKKISKKDLINKIIINNKIEYIIHLAAQAGIRDYETNIEKYIKSNILGFINILEASKKHKIKHLTYASSSSVYGNIKKLPFKENFVTESQISFYAATKKFNEIISKTYANMEHISNVGLRFFTVYGPWGRPDMSPHKFTSNIFNSLKIILNNNGNIKRDFTFINDAVEATYLIHKKKYLNVS